MKLFGSKKAFPTTVAEETVTVNTHQISLGRHSTEHPVWDIDNEPILDLGAGLDEIGVLSEVLDHSDRNSDEFEHYLFDIEKDLGENHRDKAKIAQTIEEAWDLSLALNQEIASRKAGKPGKKFLILALNFDALIELPDYVQPNEKEKEKHTQMVELLQTACAEGRDYEIYFLLI